MIDRNQLLMLSDGELCKHCSLEFFKSSGPGGQHRNKSSSAVRVTIPALGLSAEDCTERSQHRNRANALRKLKILIALTCRETPPAPPQRMECAVTAPDYPLFAAQLFDVLEFHNFDHKLSAQFCGISASALLKKLNRDPQLFQEFNRRRTLAGLPQLRA